MVATSLTVSQTRQIQWPAWTDKFEPQRSYMDLTVEILCGLSDLPTDGTCSDPKTSWYAQEAHRILQTVWPNGPLEMIRMFNEYAEYKRLEEKDKVRDPVSSAFYKLAEHAAFWTFVKGVVREQLTQVVAQPAPAPAPSPVPRQEPTQGTLGAPTIPPQETSQMHPEVSNPFGAQDTSGVISYGGDLESPPELAPEKDNTGLYVAVGLGVVLIGGVIALEFYRASKGIRPVVVSPPMMPMGVYY